MTQSKTLLVVDDDDTIRRAIVRAVSGEPYRTLQANSARRGLEILGREEVHVVLSDFHMPEMDGLEFLQLVRVHHPNVVRMMLTSDEDASVFADALNDAEVRRFLHKPWDDDQLRGALRLLLRSTPRPALMPRPDTGPRPHTPSVYQFFSKLGIDDS